MTPGARLIAAAKNGREKVMMEWQPKLIAEYLDAFAGANPNRLLPKVTYHRGWFEFRNPWIQRMRRSKLEEMTAVLRSRTPPEPRP